MLFNISIKRGDSAFMCNQSVNNESSASENPVDVDNINSSVKKYIGYLENTALVEKERYEMDFALYDRFKEMSVELVRLSLGGLAVFGVMLTSLSNDKVFEQVKSAMGSKWFQYPCVFSLSFLAFSAFLAILYRYVASDGLYYHIKLARIYSSAEIILSHANDADKSALFARLISPASPATPSKSPMEEEIDACGVLISEYSSRRKIKFKLSEKMLKAGSICLAFGSVSLAISIITLVAPKFLENLN